MRGTPEISLVLPTYLCPDRFAAVYSLEKEVEIIRNTSTDEAKKIWDALQTIRDEIDEVLERVLNPNVTVPRNSSSKFKPKP